MRTCILLLALLSTLSYADPDHDPLVGEWTVADEDCAELRMVFDFEGGYELRIAEDSRWKTLYGGRWQRDGKLIVTVTDEQRERLEIEQEGYERIVLVSRDGPVDREAGVGYLDLQRCAAY